MSKKFLFNRSVFSNAKGHDVKRKSSKGLVTGIALAGAIVLLGGSQIASADNVTISENNTTTSSTAADTDTANSQTVDSTDSDNSQVTSETVSSENSTASSEAASESNEAETNNDATASESADQSDDELSDETTSNEAQVKSQSVNALESAKYDKDDDDEEEEEVNEYKEDDKSEKADIKFDNTGVKTTSSGVNIDGKNITITSAGTYTLTGSASGYSISVADKVTDTVKLKFDAVNLTDSTLYSSRDLDIKVLSDSSISSSLKNTIETGGALYISSKKKSGLKVTSTAGHAIKANSLEADKVTLELSSTAKDGINATSNVSIKKSNVTISAEDDGIQAEDNTDVNSGDIQIKDSIVKITSTSKGITANDEITVKGSTFITITSGSEGIEGRYVNLKKGQITINAGDDAINATEWTTKDDADLSHLKNSKKDIENEVAIVISGANISGIGKDDGVDSNGNLYITDGSLKIQSITDYSSAIDYDGTGFASGGTTWAIGHMGFAQGFSKGTKQAYIAAIVSGLAGDTITITDSKGHIVAKTKADVDFDHVIFSNKTIKAGKTYTVTTSDGHKAVIKATKDTTTHPSGRHVSKDTVPLLPNGHHPAFPGNGTPPNDKN